MSGPEAPLPDALEQQQAVDEAMDPEPAGDAEIPLEADSADALEQAVEVPEPDDDRR